MLYKCFIIFEWTWKKSQSLFSSHKHVFVIIKPLRNNGWPENLAPKIHWVHWFQSLSRYCVLLQWWCHPLTPGTGSENLCTDLRTVTQFNRWHFEGERAEFKADHMTGIWRQLHNGCLKQNTLKWQIFSRTSVLLCYFSVAWGWNEHCQRSEQHLQSCKQVKVKGQMMSGL